MADQINIAVATAIPFPVGLAGTNRIVSYARGLVELGNNVTVLTSNFGQKSGTTYREV